MIFSITTVKFSYVLDIYRQIVYNIRVKVLLTNKSNKIKKGVLSYGTEKKF